MTSGLVAALTTGCVFTALGAAIALYGRSFLLLDRAIARWPTVTGTVTSSRYEASTGTSRDARGYDVTSTSFVPVVTYQYAVGDTTYDGTRVARAVTPTMDAASVKACIDRYPRGAKVQVLYDPSAPATAYLEARTSTGAKFLVGFGGLFLLAGAVTLALAVMAR